MRQFTTFLLGCVLALSFSVSSANPRTGIETVVDQRAGKNHETLVEWIEWNSRFRAAGLQIGDRIVGIDGEPLPLGFGDQVVTFGPNSNAESTHWDRSGKSAGDTVRLSVERGKSSLTIEAPLIDETAETRGPDRRRSFGENGPPTFDDKWGNLSGWYKRFKETFQIYFFPYEWSEFYRHVGRYPSEYQLRDIAEMLEVIADLEKRFPGPFTDFLREVATLAKERIFGEVRTLDEGDLDWRRIGEERARQVAAAADAAWDGILADYGERVVAEAFPAPDPSEEPIDDFIGKIVLMPAATQRDVIFEAGEVVVGELNGREATSSKSFFRHGGRGSGGVYFTPRHTVRMWAAYGAAANFSQHVMPLDRQDMTVQILGRVGEDPVLVSGEGSGATQFGLQLEPVALLVASSRSDIVRFFVDVRNVETLGDVPKFAGEDSLLKFELDPHEESTPPDAVLKRFVNAIKYGDYEAWQAMFADWEVRIERFNPDDEDPPELREVWRDQYRIERSWTASRQSMLDEEHVSRQNIAPSVIYDVEIVSQTPVVSIYEGSEQYQGLTRIDVAPTTIEETTLFVKFIGKFGDEFRTFSSRATVGYNTYWRLQRRDHGPWMIAEIDAL